MRILPPSSAARGPGRPDARRPVLRVPIPSGPIFSAESLLGVLLFLGALAVYWATLCRAPAPGQPTQALLIQLGIEIAPGALDPVWGALVRRFARLPGLSVAGWAGLFSALCGAACVGLLGRLTCRVGYLMRNQPQASSHRRERQARLLSGLVAGLYLAASIPFWRASTRSLPGAFHLLLLLLAAWIYSNYQRSGKVRNLGLLGLLYGAGMAEFATFIVFLPVALLMMWREMFQWQALRSWRGHLLFWGGLALGLALYPLHARYLFRQGAAFGLYSSPWDAWMQILQAQAQLITQAPYRNPVFLFIMVFGLAIWLLLFTMSHRSPWFYEADQIIVRVVFAGILLFILSMVRLAWERLGIANLMLTPLLLMGASMGYVAGELWIFGEIQVLTDISPARRILRRVFSALALMLPVAVLAAGIQNRRVVDGRHAAVVEAAAREALDRLAGRDIVFSTGLLDDAMRLAVWERNLPVRMISVGRTTSPPYLRQVSRGFSEEVLRVPLQQGNFSQFLENLLLSGEGPARTAILDMPEVFREFGYLVPDGFVYRLEPSADRLDLPALIESQRPFWVRMEQMAARPVPEDNLIRPYQNLLLLLVAKVVNNLGVMQAERGDEAGALETWRAARRIYPGNLSVLMNLLALAPGRDLPEAADWEADWDDWRNRNDPARWNLANFYGYVWNASAWVRRAGVWALSGAPMSSEAARRMPPASAADDEAHARLVEQIYLIWGTPFRNESFYRSVLMQDEKNIGALVALARLALRRNDADSAAAYLDEAHALGLGDDDSALARALVAYVRGDRESALAALRELTRKVPGDARGWMALLLLTDEQDPANAEALKILKSFPAPSLSLRLSLAWIHLQRFQWAEAQAELDRAVQLDTRNVLTWELMTTVAQIRGIPKLRAASLSAVFAQNPGHPLRAVELAQECFQRGAVAEAEAGLRASLRRTRNPDALNALASLIQEQATGDLAEARALADEAVRRQPFHPMFRGLRGELLFKIGQLDAAEEDLRLASQALPDHLQARLLLAGIHQARGDVSQACELARELARRRDEMSPQQRERLDRLLLPCGGDG